MCFTHKDWGQCDITNKNISLTKRVSDTIYTNFPKKYQKYPSTTIVKLANVLAKVHKYPYGCLLNMTPHDAYIITIQVCTMTLVDISHEQKE